MNAIADRPLAEVIPDPDTIRHALERTEIEANFLRKQLRLSIARQREAERLLRESKGREVAGHAH